MCDVCKNHLRPTRTFSSVVTKETFSIKHHVNCKSTNCIYLIKCKICDIQYVGSTVNFTSRWRLHKSQIKLKKTASCRVANHWANNHSFVENLEITIMEKVEAPTEELDSKLSDREIYWQPALITFEPYSLNKRDDVYSCRTRF